eukprot:3211765-Pleurochrysis_carterae.AAC.2
MNKNDGTCEYHDYSWSDVCAAADFLTNNGRRCGAPEGSKSGSQSSAPAAKIARTCRNKSSERVRVNGIGTRTSDRAAGGGALGSKIKL